MCEAIRPPVQDSASESLRCLSRKRSPMATARRSVFNECWFGKIQNFSGWILFVRNQTNGTIITRVGLQAKGGMTGDSRSGRSLKTEEKEMCHATRWAEIQFECVAHF